MKDKVVLLSFVISIVGLIAIYLLSHNAKPEYLSISQLTTNLVGKIVSTGGFSFGPFRRRTNLVCRTAALEFCFRFSTRQFTRQKNSPLALSF